ncbi:hypothetical protein EVAR_94469_1 [Eumeta japonica]|uniref:Uncharacterized protein n=1 Tax=Eumeta variegata TaxID=151549 RepID=A0A4C1UVZ7_EUMVA|nr:hypothetical protein EVAR_94469_1 [Eumeta japonica]
MRTSTPSPQQALRPPQAPNDDVQKLIAIKTTKLDTDRLKNTSSLALGLQRLHYTPGAHAGRARRARTPGTHVRFNIP